MSVGNLFLPLAVLLFSTLRIVDEELNTIARGKVNVWVGKR
jgi:hypothetical protein